MKPRVLALMFLAVLVGCSRADPPTRQAVPFSRSAAIAILKRASTKTSRMDVIFWPALGKCIGCENSSRRALSEIVLKYPDVRVVTVVPKGTLADGGEPFPGEVVEIEAMLYHFQSSAAPLPRIEVWALSGQPLLVKSIPPSLKAGKDLFAEVEACRAFTAPTSPDDA